MAVDEDPICRCVYLTQALGSHRIREVTMFEFQPSTTIDGQWVNKCGDVDLRAEAATEPGFVLIFFVGKHWY